MTLLFLTLLLVFGPSLAFLAFAEHVSGGALSNIARLHFEDLRRRLERMVRPRVLLSGSLPIETSAARHPPPGLREIYEELDRDLGIVDPHLLTAPERKPEKPKAEDYPNKWLTVPERSGSTPHEVTLHIGVTKDDFERRVRLVREAAETDRALAVREIAWLTHELERERVRFTHKVKDFRERLYKAQSLADLARAEAEAVTKERDEIASESWRRRCEIEELKSKLDHARIENAELLGKLETLHFVEAHRQEPNPLRH